MALKNTPHITVVAGYFYPKIGGLENYAYLLAKKLRDSGRYTVSIITSNYSGSGYVKETIDGMTVHRLPISFRVSNTPINLSWYADVRRIFANEQPDIVHVHAPVPYLPDIAAAVAHRRKIPIVLTYHAGSMLKGKQPIDVIIKLYEKIFLYKLFQRADAVITISQDFAKKTFPQFIHKMHFIPTGVDLNRFKKTPLPSDTEVVTFVGRIEHSSSWKGVNELLHAFALVLQSRPQAKLELIGGGDAVEYYRAEADKLGITENTMFYGAQTGQALVDAYKRSNVIVLPSQSDSEAFSIVLVEAQASGRPIIATNIGGNPQVVEPEKNGLLVPIRNPEKLAAAITRVLDDKTFAARLADYGADKAQGFSWDIQAAKYSDLFQKYINDI